MIALSTTSCAGRDRLPGGEAHDGFVQAANAPGGGAVLRIGFGPALRLGETAPETDVGASSD